MITPEQEKAEEEREFMLMVEQEEIDAGKRVKEFLADPAVQEVLKRIEKQYLGDFREADTDDKRRNVWASTKALQDFVAALGGTLDSGRFAAHKRSTREAQEAATPARNPRR